MLLASSGGGLGWEFVVAIIIIAYGIEQMTKAAVQNEHVQQGTANWFMSWFK